MKSYVLAALLALVAAAVVGAFANGMFQAAENAQLANQIGRGMTGEDLGNLRRETGMQEGCTTGGEVVFWGLWLGGTALLGRRMNRKKGQREERSATGL